MIGGSSGVGQGGREHLPHLGRCCTVDRLTLPRAEELVCRQKKGLVADDCITAQVFAPHVTSLKGSCKVQISKVQGLMSTIRANVAAYALSAFQNTLRHKSSPDGQGEVMTRVRLTVALSGGCPLSHTRNRICTTDPTGRLELMLQFCNPTFANS